MNIEIDQEKLIEVAAARLLADEEIEVRVTALVTKRIDEEIDKRLTELFDERVQARILEEVEEKITLGWADFTRYGQSGPVKSLRERVADRLERKEYRNGTEMNYVDWAVKDRIDDFIKRELVEEARATRAKFAKAVDAVLQAKLVETIRASVFGS